MRLYYFSGENGVTNFGDELNHLIWRHFLPGLLDDDASAQFVGIGVDARGRHHDGDDSLPPIRIFYPDDGHCAFKHFDHWAPASFAWLSERLNAVE